MREIDGGGDHPTPPVVRGAVLIGGGSQRMGRDKAAVTVDGQPLVERAVAALQAALDAPSAVVLVVGPHPEIEAGRNVPSLPAHAHRVSDLRVDAGPLAGLEAALATADVHPPDELATPPPPAEVVLLAGVDHPWLVPGVLARLVEHLSTAPSETAGVVLGTGQGPQLLLGAYRTTALEQIRHLLDVGERRLRSLQDHLHLEVLPPEAWRDLDPLGATAMDVDDPHALASAIRWHARASATATQPRHRHSRAPSAEHTARQTRQVLAIRARPATTSGGAGANPHDDGPLEVTERADVLAGEAPLTISAAGPGQRPITIATVLRTPGQEAELALGRLLTEGVAAPRDLVDADTAVSDIDAATGAPMAVVVRLRRPVDGGRPTRHHGSGGGEVTGEVDGSDAFTSRPLAWRRLSGLTEELRLAQGPARSTGGSHAAGLCDAEGRLVTFREDVGRHNALDTVIGAHLRAAIWPDEGLTDLVCVLSCRVGHALVTSAAAARVPVIAAVGSASDLAVRTADDLGITLVGALRDGAGTVYTHPHRLLLT